MGKQPLKILQVASAFYGWGGTELHLLNLSEQLVSRGHQVTVACRPGKFVEEQAKKRGLKTVPAVTQHQSDWECRGEFRRILRSERFDVVHVHWHSDYMVPP